MSYKAVETSCQELLTALARIVSNGLVLSVKTCHSNWKKKAFEHAEYDKESSDNNSCCRLDGGKYDKHKEAHHSCVRIMIIGFLTLQWKQSGVEQGGGTALHKNTGVIMITNRLSAISSLRRSDCVRPSAFPHLLYPISGIWKMNVALRDAQKLIARLSFKERSIFSLFYIPALV